ncbi:MAG: ATP-binding protein, partial [Nitrospira sp.]|nr:ATP-binding protein [Nitrospira sp.]
MSDRVAYDTWVQANQRCLVGEFDRLKARLTGGESAETAGHTIDEIDAEGPAQAAIDVLTNLFGLSRFERDVLLLCAGVEMNSELARVCGEALAPGHRSSVTFGLALAALEAPHWSALTPVGPLRRWRLVELDES